MTKARTSQGKTVRASKATKGRGAKARTAAQDRRRSKQATRRASQAEREVLAFDGLDIELRSFARLDFKPTRVVVGISAEGVVAPLVASHLVSQLALDQVCALESPQFPPTSMVYYERPKFPARIYASKRHRLAVVLAEFGPADELARPLAYVIRAWCQAHGVKRTYGIDSFQSGAAAPQGVPLAAVGATTRDRERILKAKVPGVRHGAVTGVAGVLLNEGRWADEETVVLMASLGLGSDAEAAAHVLGALARLEPNLPIRQEAGGAEPSDFEKAIQAAHRREASHEFI